MNQHPARLVSPVALLTGLALLCAALAGALAFAPKAEAATVLGSFTLSPASGKLTDAPPAASVTTSAGCPDPADPAKPYNANLWVFRANGTPKQPVAKTAETVPVGTVPFTAQLLAGTATLEKALAGINPTLDGTYTLGLLCGSGSAVDRFLAKITVVGDTWTLVQQQPVTLGLDAPQDVPVGGDLKLTATVTPAAAAGSVEFKEGETSLGTAEVTGGTAERTVKASAIGGPHTYTAVFTPSDAEAYTDATASATRGLTYLVSAKGADGSALPDKPTLAIGQSAKITVKGFTPGATVEVSQSNATEAAFADATADAEGTVTDYLYTVPERTISGDTTLYFSEGGSANHRAAFTFDATDEPTDEPTDPADLEVTDEDGNPLGANPDLEPGQTVRITAAGYSADAAVKVTLAGREETFQDAKANAEGTVEEYAFTVPEEIEDGDHTLTLAEQKTDGHSVDFAFTTGAETGESADPSGSASASGDDSGTAGDGSDGGGSGSDGDTGGSGGSGSGTGGVMASTGAQVGAVALTSLALLLAGAALVLHMRRRGLLAFGTDTPQHR
ncbi:Ig-like domain repeat protein [Streptomyces sp. JW3]|uniref:Ig-like domain repeat protein n=1 Tax=Streptomyces sp. JW3 TaxID=3456955 RepID=UPI003FA473C1